MDIKLKKETNKPEKRPDIEGLKAIYLPLRSVYSSVIIELIEYIEYLEAMKIELTKK